MTNNHHETFSGPLMQGKRGLVFGVANELSLAWGIARVLAAHGATLGFTYQGEVMKKRVTPLAQQVGSDMIVSCDVTQEEDLKHVFHEVEKAWGTLDFVVHAVAFSDKKELQGDFLQMTKANFLHTMHVSCYSFIEIAQYAAPLMTQGGSLLTLSYYGAEKVVPHYNVMGVAKAALECSVRYAAEDLGKKDIRVNALSCGPIRTLAASGIGDFRYILQWNQYNSPLRRNITLDDVGGSGLYLLSDLGKGVTGEVLHVDAGYHAIGMKAIDAPDLTLPRQE
jgi:enoyl-[acyl-carrier protein] reductase I